MYNYICLTVVGATSSNKHFACELTAMKFIRQSNLGKVLLGVNAIESTLNISVVWLVNYK